MPIYEYMCSECGEWSEDIREYRDRDKHTRCSNGHSMHRMASEVYTRPERMYVDHPQLGRVIKNDSKNPWEGSALEGRQSPNRGRYKQRKIQMDMGSKTITQAKEF